MKPTLRMCIVCRQMKPKEELLRIAKYENSFSLDILGKMPGRGAYICKDGDCKEGFQKKRSFERAFKCAVPEDLKETIKKELI